MSTQWAWYSHQVTGHSCCDDGIRAIDEYTTHNQQHYKKTSQKLSMITAITRTSSSALYVLRWSCTEDSPINSHSSSSPTWRRKNNYKGWIHTWRETGWIVATHRYDVHVYSCHYCQTHTWNSQDKTEDTGHSSGIEDVWKNPSNNPTYKHGRVHVLNIHYTDGDGIWNAICDIAELKMWHY